MENGQTASSKSTTDNRSLQRGNMGIQVLYGTVGTVNNSPSSSIPLKFAQCATSFFAMFRHKLKPVERVTHGIQGVLAMAQLVLLSLIYFKKINCTEETSVFCDSSFYIDFLYAGTLLTAWGAAELYKEPHPINEQGHELLPMTRNNSV